ncbi:hypothetical protein AB5I41_16805 [Sphingomonas sp. MMS24-JH45]
MRAQGDGWRLTQVRYRPIGVAGRQAADLDASLLRERGECDADLHADARPHRDDAAGGQRARRPQRRAQAIIATA